MAFLSGYKTYLVAFGVAVVAGLHQLGYVNDSLQATLLTILGGGGLAALRAAFEKK